MNFALASPVLAKAWAIAAGFWLSATSGFVHLDQVDYCTEENLPCVTVRQVPSLEGGYIGMTHKYGKAYSIEVLDPDPLVISHEIGHLILSLGYHAPPNMSIMSPTVGGHRCLGDSDVWIYRFWYHRELKLLCVP